MSMRKKLTSLMLVATMAFGMVGCGSTAKEEEQQTTQNADGQLSGKVTVWSWTEAKMSLEDAAKLFQKEHPEVEFEFVEYSSGDIATKLATSLQTGQGLPDIASVEGDGLAGLVSNFGYALADTTETLADVKDDFLPYKLEEVTFEGAQKAIPYDACPSMMFYRTDLFEKAGIVAEDIKTWDDYLEAGKILKEKTGVDMLTMDFAGDDGLYRQMLMQQGTFYLDNSGEIALNSEESKTATNMIKKINDAGILNNHKSWDDMITAYKNDTVATAVFGTWFIGTLKSSDIGNGLWNVMPMPAFEEGGSTSAVNGGSDLVIPDKAENKEAALEFAKFAAGTMEPTKNLFASYGQLPAYMPVLDDEVFNEGDPYFGDQAIWQPIIEEGKKATPPNYSAKYQDLKTLVCNNFSTILLNGADVDSTLETLETEGKKILEN